MRTVYFWLILVATLLSLMLAVPVAAQSNPIPDAPQANAANIIGTVIDLNNDVVPGATVVLKGAVPEDTQTVTANDEGYFEFHNLKPGIPYKVAIHAEGFADWTSSPLVLDPGQYKILTDAKLKVEEAKSTITVQYSSEEVATLQVQTEETQRIFGFVPNFYVSYDPNPEPLTTRLKFKLAWKVATDPVSIAAAAFMAGIDQAADRPNYVQGAKGYGQRFGAVYADEFTDIMVGGAILPSLLHQDPRYFYKGTGTVKSRVLHAMSNPFVCKGDNGHMQPNYSSMGGDLASSAMSNLYYPSSNRGANLVFGNFAISTGERLASSLAQEFILGRFTRHPKVQDQH